MRLVLAMLLVAPASLSPAQVFPPAPFCPGGQCPVLAGPQMAPSDSSSGPASENLGVESSAVVRIANSQSNGRVFGSGTLVDVDGQRGLILTCAHLFRGPVGALDVTFPDSQTFQARLVKIDAAVDLAAVEIRPPRIMPIAIADNSPKPGDPLISCGYGSDGRLWCNRGQALGYVTLVGGENFETLELTGTARSGDSGGPVLDRDHRLVAVLFGTNGRVVDGTFCGRVKRFLANLCPRLHARTPLNPAAPPRSSVARANPPEIAPPPQAAPPGDQAAQEPLPAEAQIAPPAANPGGDLPPASGGGPPLPNGPDPIGAAADQVGAVVEPWISARVAALLVSLGVPGGVAGVAAGAAVWLVMRRGKRRLQQQLDRLRPAGDRTASEATSDARTDDQQVIERHHNRYVAYETTALDKAWAAAHAHVGEKYPGAVPYLKMAEGVKEQLLAGNKDPQIS